MILDRQAVLERIDHDQDLYDEICGIFRDDVPQLVVQLKEAVASCNLPVAIRHAHSLKSASANIGATDLCESARLLEECFRAGKLDNIDTLISALDQNLSHVLVELK